MDGIFARWRCSLSRAKAYREIVERRRRRRRRRRKSTSTKSTKCPTFEVLDLNGTPRVSQWYILATDIQHPSFFRGIFWREKERDINCIESSASFHRVSLRTPACTPVTHIACADIASPRDEKLRDVALEDSRPIDERFTAFFYLLSGTVVFLPSVSFNRENALDA